MYIVHSAGHNNVLYHIMTIIYTSEQGTTYNVQHTMYNVQHTCNVIQKQNLEEGWKGGELKGIESLPQNLIFLSLYLCITVMMF